MALVFRRRLAMPLWAIAFFTVALAAPSSAIPPVTVLLGIAVIALTMMAMVQWRCTSRQLVEVLPAARGEPALPLLLIPGSREPGRLTTFDVSAEHVRIPAGSSSMDAATLAERQREGGGAPSQRRPARERSRWNLGHTVPRFLMTARALFARRFRINHV